MSPSFLTLISVLLQRLNTNQAVLMSRYYRNGPVGSCFEKGRSHFQSSMAESLRINLKHDFNGHLPRHRLTSVLLRQGFCGHFLSSC